MCIFFRLFHRKRAGRYVRRFGADGPKGWDEGCAPAARPPDVVESCTKCNSIQRSSSMAVYRPAARSFSHEREKDARTRGRKKNAGAAGNKNANPGAYMRFFSRIPLQAESLSIPLAATSGHPPHTVIFVPNVAERCYRCALLPRDLAIVRTSRRVHTDTVPERTNERRWVYVSIPVRICCLIFRKAGIRLSSVRIARSWTTIGPMRKRGERPGELREDEQSPWKKNGDEPIERDMVSSGP